MSTIPCRSASIFTDEAIKGGDAAGSVDELLEGIAPVVQMCIRDR